MFFTTIYCYQLNVTGTQWIAFKVSFCVLSRDIHTPGTAESKFKLSKTKKDSIFFSLTNYTIFLHLIKIPFKNKIFLFSATLKSNNFRCTGHEELVFNSLEAKFYGECNNLKKMQWNIFRFEDIVWCLRQCFVNFGVFKPHKCFSRQFTAIN